MLVRKIPARGEADTKVRDPAGAGHCSVLQFTAGAVGTRPIRRPTRQQAARWR